MANTGLASGHANNWLAILQAGTAYPSPPANIYQQLHTGQPGAAGTSNISAGSTTRVISPYAAPSAGSIAQTGTNPVWTNGGTSETLTIISEWSALTAGTFFWSFTLSASQAWVSTNTFTMTTYSLALTPIAA